MTKVVPLTGPRGPGLHDIPGPVEAVVDLLELYLAMAKRGEIAGVFLGAIAPNGYNMHNWATGRNVTTVSLIGLLHVASADITNHYMQNCDSVPITAPQDDPQG